MKIKIDLRRSFIKSYNKRVKSRSNLVSRVKERIRIFEVNQNDSRLRLHRLHGAKSDLLSFSITGDIRIVFRYLERKEEIIVEFIDIGTHNQVY